jgi:hypothetical protein
LSSHGSIKSIFNLFNSLFSIIDNLIIDNRTIKGASISQRRKKHSNMMNPIAFFLLATTLLISVNAEGYICPYKSLGFDGTNTLLYDYYNDMDGSYWTRKGETGWESVSEYCRQKGDLSIHVDAGEWKCNDSKNICKWDGSGCSVNNNRKADCRALCQAIIDGKGPACLGNCPDGHTSNDLYKKYCPTTTKSKLKSKRTIATRCAT